MATATATELVEIKIALYRLEDGSGKCIASEVDFDLDSDNDVVIHADNHYFIEQDEYELLEKAKELTQDDWDIIATQQLLTSE